METLLHLNYLNRIYILVNLENEKDYSLHLKIGSSIERKVYNEMDGKEKERLVGYLISVERYHLWQESIESVRPIDEVRKEDSYIKLVDFIGRLSPGYLYRWAYIEELKVVKEVGGWVSTYQGTPLIYNQIQKPQVVFHLKLDFERQTKEIKQSIEWVIPKKELLLNNPDMEKELQIIKEDSLLYFKQSVNPMIPGMFEGFEELLDE